MPRRRPFRSATVAACTALLALSLSCQALLSFGDGAATGETADAAVTDGAALDASETRESQANDGGAPGDALDVDGSFCEDFSDDFETAVSPGTGWNDLVLEDDASAELFDAESRAVRFAMAAGHRDKLASLLRVARPGKRVQSIDVSARIRVVSASADTSQAVLGIGQNDGVANAAFVNLFQVPPNHAAAVYFIASDGDASVPLMERATIDSFPAGWVAVRLRIDGHTVTASIDDAAIGSAATVPTVPFLPDAAVATTVNVGIIYATDAATTVDVDDVSIRICYESPAR